MFMKNFIFIILLTAILLPLLVSCKATPSTNTTESTTAAESTTTTESSTEAPQEPFDPIVYNVVPDIIWAYATKNSEQTPFTMGDGTYSFNFSNVDISTMKYLEFDLYIPSVENYANITEDTQFEITSSGTYDKNEFAWVGHKNGILSGQTITEGWNHIKIELPEMPEVDRTAVNFIRWYWVSPKSTISGCSIANFRFTTDESVDPLITASGFIVNTVYPTDDIVIATADITKAPYNADSTGKTDVTAVINQALKDVSDAGGGTVFMPVGQYLVTDTISIPAYCTLRGDWQDPDIGTDYGTVILANPQVNVPVNESLFLISGSAGVNGLTIYYPEQSLEAIKEYPFTFYNTGKGASYMLPSITNCTVINGYRGIGACVLESNAHEQFSIENLKGTFLYTAAEVYNQADVGTWKKVYVNSSYWENCPLGQTAVDKTALRSYLRQNAVGLILGDLEWTEFVDLRISGYNYGIRIVKGHRIEFAGSIYDAHITDCTIAL